MASSRKPPLQFCSSQLTFLVRSLFRIGKFLFCLLRREPRQGYCAAQLSVVEHLLELLGSPDLVGLWRPLK
jgi:hypothetical protein